MEFVDQDEYQKGLPFLISFIISIAVTLALVLIYSFGGLHEDPFLTQVFIILVLFSVCLTGILTRSKLKGLANIFVAPFAVLPAVVGINSPWGLATELKILGDDFVGWMEAHVNDPNFEIAQSDIDSIKPFVGYLVLIDLVLIIFMALVFGFFCSMIATGFFRKDGSFAPITIISKPLAIIFILMLLPVGIAYHGGMKVGETVMSVGMGVLVLADVADEMGDADPDSISIVTKAFEEAQEYFDQGRLAFDHAQNNFFFQLLLDYYGETATGIGSGDGVTIDEFVDLADNLLEALYYMAGASPGLYGGMANFVEGMNDSFYAMGMEEVGGAASQSAQSSERLHSISDLDPVTFAQGIGLLTTAISYFDNSTDDFLNLIEVEQKLVQSSGYEKLTEGGDETADALEALEAAEIVIPKAIDMANGTIWFLKATFGLLLAVEDLGDNDFLIARQHLGWASYNFTIADQIFKATLSGLNESSPIAQSELTNPVYGGLLALTNMTTLITHFTHAAVNGTDTLLSVNMTTSLLAGIDLNATLSDPTNQQFWADGADYINWAAVNMSGSLPLFKGAADFIDDAANQADAMVAMDYGEIDESMDEFTGELVGQLGTNKEEGFRKNVTDFGIVMESVNYTYYSLWSFANGFDRYRNATAQWNVSGTWTNDSSTWSDSYKGNMSLASHWFTLSYENATIGQDKIDKVALKMDPGTEDALYDTNNDVKLAAIICQGLTEGASNGSLLAVEILNQMDAQFSNVETAQGLLDGAFGTSGGLQAYSTKIRPESKNANSELSFIIDKDVENIAGSSSVSFPFFFAIALFATAFYIRRKR